MGSVTRIFKQRILDKHGHNHAGVFTWEVDSDLFFADQAIAQLFEIDPLEAESGLPLMTYLDCIHPGDRARAAKSIHDTILSGGPCQQDYRILQREGPPIEVMAFGKCFKDRNGSVMHYAGVIHAIPPKDRPSDDMRSHCLSAHAAAVGKGDIEVARHLADALKAMELEPSAHQSD